MPTSVPACDLGRVPGELAAMRAPGTGRAGLVRRRGAAQAVLAAEVLSSRAMAQLRGACPPHRGQQASLAAAPPCTASGSERRPATDAARALATWRQEGSLSSTAGVLPRQRRSPSSPVGFQNKRPGFTPVVAFREDDGPGSLPPAGVPSRTASTISGGSAGSLLSPWAMTLMAEGSTLGWNQEMGKDSGWGGSGPRGGGNGKGRGGGGGGDEGEGESAEGRGEDWHWSPGRAVLPFLSVLFFLAHVAFCVAAICKAGRNPRARFLSPGLPLSALLFCSALRLNTYPFCLDAYVLGLGSAAGLTVWAGERCVKLREMAPSGLMCLLSASMTLIYSGALFGVVSA